MLIAAGMLQACAVAFCTCCNAARSWPDRAATLIGAGRILGGSWVVISRVISRVTILITNYLYPIYPILADLQPHL